MREECPLIPNFLLCKLSAQLERGEGEREREGERGCERERGRERERERERERGRKKR